ncbi:MAG: transposase [Lachnospiraceae bacterium]|nr:transposase [Lachnospiraceae bacterium]MDE7203536.1 transposase [Lachnospiraceae bacterium]
MGTASTDSTVTKTIWQYSMPLPEETMVFLRGIAADCCKVKNYVYGKYSGVKNLNNLTPVYNILNEMRHCGLREQLNLPAVYYELAIADAVTNIKCNWGTVKNRVGECITANENLSDGDKIYLRTVLKMNGVYAAILNRREYEMPRNAAGLDIDVKRLNNLLCRLTRRYLTQPKTESTAIFRVSPNGYSYKDGVMRIVCRVPRKRISIPLRDNRTFDRQIQIQIRQNDVALAVPVEAKVKQHPDYTNTIYIHIGNKDMFTLSNEHLYGVSLEELTNPETERLSKKNRERRKMYTAHEQSAEDGDARKAANIEANNLGKLKYDRQKEREKVRTTTFINSEINRMIRSEKPARIVIAKQVTKNKTKIYNKSTNRKLARSFNSYIRERLAYKCKVHSIELVEISSKHTGNICSICGAEGKRQGKEFVCESCGLKTTIALNSARNTEQRYLMRSVD